MRSNPMSFIYLLSFGSNLGNKQKNIELAYQDLSTVGQVLTISQIIETEPLRSNHYDTSTHASYCNSVCEYKTTKNPADLYAFIASVENKIGHSRASKWQPRELDIDILFATNTEHDSFICGEPLLWQDSNGLTVPHREFWKRNFLVDLVTIQLNIEANILKKHSQKTDQG